jgi:uncharacterized phage-like protein YoqJ
MTDWTIAMTGHRPQALDSDFGYNSELWQFIYAELRNTFEKQKPSKIITGMALGVDTVAAEVALAMEIPFVAAVPFPGQDAKWSTPQQEHYHMLLSYAAHIETCDKGPYSPYLMEKRNRWMVDNADIVVAVWNGWKGGTRNCVDYAIRQQVPVWRIDPVTRKVGRYDGTKHIVKELVHG